MTRRAPPRVSAVVPAYKSAGFVGRTLDSLAAQTWDNLEILVGDDASPDGTADVIRAFAAHHPNVRAVLRTQNLGWMGNTNDLMARATGEFRFFMPHDDTIEPTYVEALVDALERTPEAVLAYSDLDFSKRGEAPGVRRFEDLAGVEGARGRALALARMPRDWWVPHRGLFRSEVYRQVGGLRPTPFLGHFAADFTWVYQMALAGPFVRVPEVLYHKVWMPESLSRAWTGSLLSNGALMLGAAQATLRSRLGPGEKAGILVGLAGSAAARGVRGAAARAGHRRGRTAS